MAVKSQGRKVTVASGATSTKLRVCELRCGRAWTGTEELGDKAGQDRKREDQDEGCMRSLVTFPDVVALSHRFRMRVEQGPP